MITNKTTPTIKGDQIGSWKMGETLGLGSTGKVQLAYNKTTGNQAAIKVISKTIFQDSNVTSMVDNTTPDALPYGIEREIVIMKLLNHANVLRLYDVWETNSNLYMVLEYAEKGELFNLLVERGPLPENEAIRFFRQIIIGISYCHALGIVHRDLKPENLLLDTKYNIKIADFGMAALETEDKLLETSCGSPHYAAPEIVSGIPYHGFASDVWSCGVILYALLTGRLPFDEEDGNIRNLLLKVQAGQFEMPEDDEISKEAQNLISKILVVNPAERITARDILKHPLLQKYPSIKDSKSIRNLPREDTYLHPLAETNSAIDENILQNLVVLWHGRDPAEIRVKLKEHGANAEKTLYAMLNRFKLDVEQENLKNEHLKNRQSGGQSTSMAPATNQSTAVNRSSGNKNTTPRKKNRASVISVTSSHKRPISFQKLPTLNSTSSLAAITPSTSARRKRLSKISGYPVSNVNGSPTPASRKKRNSMANIQAARSSTIKKTNTFKKNNRASKRVSILPNNKNGTIASKLISTYAKLSEDDEWEYLEQETKRTSSNFATLIDEIFEHEKYEQIRKEKEELARKVREAKEREEAERKQKELQEREKQRERERKENETNDRQRIMEEEIENLKKELDMMSHEGKTESRSVSEPLNKKQGGVEIEVKELLRQRNAALQTRPKSRLDPGLFFDSAESDTRNPSLQVFEGEVDNKLKTEKAILETIRRSKFLGSSFDISKELKSASARSDYSRAPGRVITAPSNLERSDVLPKNAIATAPLRIHSDQPEVRKISDIKVPQFTRKSRNFSESSKRLSVLSMYSTRQSFKNLSDMMNFESENTDAAENRGQIATPNSAGQSEFLFESVNEEAENTNNTSTDGKLYEVSESPESSSKKGLRVNLSDRYNKANSEADMENKLPILPPLDPEIAGLGIYQDQPEEVNAKPQEKKSKSKSAETGDISEGEPEVSDLKAENIRKAPQPPITEKKKLDAKKQRNDERTKASKENTFSNNFLRKLSGQSNTTTQSVKKTKLGAEDGIHTTVSATQMYQGLYNLLRGWGSYGLKSIKGNSENMTITGKLASENILSLRSTIFEIIIIREGKGSKVDIKKKSGSTKAVNRLAGEVKNVLVKEGVMITIK
ncbi:protein kinase GIN4 KNAG_0F00290 [Huiozyma naganishii CBS 8797]|uniref:non-specific serine/threonine protein kinase n=1 Tax=Huiozyma naganishii (strain ATCC MYA-139 / BCRC 22969 / CBS 8797 / KCTC 17520 / NBRC 10181 / NCYC 3082 / Yp74L-3) TaxID=1071383 RepID=J7S853_HUIN7|nr:hypothetical protein KNAG_0F00290 [Kazachstania naganishii CBS 8797]CCK70701.1 hypothetical protein KNAG_0F00290 [Kazachstania naganishii CBS 8797]